MKPIFAAQLIKVGATNNVAVRMNKGEFEFNARKAAAILGKHISHVVGMGAEEKMVRAHAGRVVTFMQNMHAFFECAVRKSVRNPVSVLPETLFSEHNRKTPVTSRLLQLPNPNPAVAGLIDFLPKSFLKTYHAILSLFGDDYNPQWGENQLEGGGI